MFSFFFSVFFSAFFCFVSFSFFLSRCPFFFFLFSFSFFFWARVRRYCILRSRPGAGEARCNSAAFAEKRTWGKHLAGSMRLPCQAVRCPGFRKTRLLFWPSPFWRPPPGPFLRPGLWHQILRGGGVHRLYTILKDHG